MVTSYKQDEVIMNNRNSNSLAVKYQPTASTTRVALTISLFAVLFFAAFANAQCVPNCLFYGGDFEPNNPNANGLANENDAIVSGPLYGAATFQNFVIPRGQSWTIQSLFTNNLSDLNPGSAYFEIRSGVSEGDGGTLIASGLGTTGAGTFTWTPTSRNGEFTAHVTGQNIVLPAGMYWESVVPQSLNESGRSFNTNTFTRPNGVGDQVNDQQYWDSAFFGANFTNADTQGVFQTLSSGLDGYATPEPSSLIMLGTGVIGIGGLLRRRLLG